MLRDTIINKLTQAIADIDAKDFEIKRQEAELQATRNKLQQERSRLVEQLQSELKSSDLLPYDGLCGAPGATLFQRDSKEEKTTGQDEIKGCYI